MPNAETEPQWYVERDGQLHGPSSLAELRQLLDGGRIAATDRLWCQERGWAVASRVLLAAFPARRAARRPSPGLGLDVRRLGDLLSGAGIFLLFLSGLVWFVNTPELTGDQAMILRFSVPNPAQAVEAAQAAYIQCLYSSTFPLWGQCPLGGNLHLLVFLGVGLAAVGLIIRASAEQ